MKIVQKVESDGEGGGGKPESGSIIVGHSYPKKQLPLNVKTLIFFKINFH